MQSLTAAFETPLAEHTPCPFWFWNGDLDADEIRRQIDLMVAKGIRAFVLHARHGLKIEYLSEAWFEACAVALAKASDLGMKVWIYDEYNWPSGYAGGRVLARDPEYVARNLVVQRLYVEGPTAGNLSLERSGEVIAVAACRLEAVEPRFGDSLEVRNREPEPHRWTDTSLHAHTYAAGAPAVLGRPTPEGTLRLDLPEGRWCVFVARQHATDWNAAYSTNRYPDLINGTAVDAFIAETHEQYYRRFASQFGRTILGFFVDEPGFYNNFWDRNVGSVPWTSDFTREFEQRRGYDIREWFPVLWEHLGERTEQVRFDYWKTVGELLQERFFGKLGCWCEAHGVGLTGHLHWEEWLMTMTRHSVNPFEALASLHVPGVDKIDEVTDKLSEKLVASVAHLTGRQRVLSETFANIGWKLAPPYMKRMIDAQYVRGVNWLSCHAFYYSIEGFRQRECPPSEFFQNPWWGHSRPLWDYVSRLSAVMSSGQHVAAVAIYYPIDQAWVGMTPAAPGPFSGQVWEVWQLPSQELPVQRADVTMIRIGLSLLAHQYDFDLVDHTNLRRANTVEGRLRIGSQSYAAVIVPPVDVLAADVLSRLLALAAAGGTVIFVDRLAERVVNGDVPSDWPELRRQLRAMAQPGVLSLGRGAIGFVPWGVDAVARLLRLRLEPDVEVWLDEDQMITSDLNRGGMLRETRIQPLRSALRYIHRCTGGDDIYFVVNESDRRFTAHMRLVGGPTAEEWFPVSGERRGLPAAALGDGRLMLTLTFGPWESHLIVLGRGGAPEPPPWKVVQETCLTAWTLWLNGRVWEGPLCSWNELGASWYSGDGEYRATFQLAEPMRATTRILLDLGDVLETAEVAVNGKTVGALAWSPYRVDITDAVRCGVNALTVTVANTNANAFEHFERPSGLMGPVRLLTMTTETARESPEAPS